EAGCTCPLSEICPSRASFTCRGSLRRNRPKRLDAVMLGTPAPLEPALFAVAHDLTLEVVSELVDRCAPVGRGIFGVQRGSLREDVCLGRLAAVLALLDQLDLDGCSVCQLLRKPTKLRLRMIPNLLAELEVAGPDV